MKKLLLASLIALSSYASIGQSCNTTYQDSTFGAWPDTITNFAPATVGVQYLDSLHFKVPANASEIMPNVNATINHFKVNNVTGLPASLQYNCSVSTCQFPGNSVGCAWISGTPTASEVGVHAVTIEVIGNVNMPIVGATNIDYDFTGYKIVVSADENLAVSLITPEQSFIYPNPGSDVFTVVNAHHYEQVTVLALNGQTLLSQQISSTDEVVDISALNSGVYLVQLTKGSKTIVQKFVKK